MEIPKGLSWSEQVSLLRSRGMKIDDTDERMLKSVSYYRIKEFAAPLATLDRVNGKIDYHGIKFSEVLKRYYQDKNLRLNLLHAIEQVEVALKTRLAYILGQYYGAYGYLDFYKWVNRTKISNFEIEKKQYYFKQQLLKNVNKSSMPDLKLKSNQNSDGFPTVWLAIDSLMFGNLVAIVSLINTKHLKKLASYFDCTGKELISWIRCLNFIRNICAHNSDVIDIKLNTVPLIRASWKRGLYIIHGEQSKRPTNRLAVVLFVLVTMVNAVNTRYRWKDINNNIKNICSGNDNNARLIGFKDCQSIDIRNMARNVSR